jgi:hypothetical protein
MSALFEYRSIKQKKNLLKHLKQISNIFIKHFFNVVGMPIFITVIMIEVLGFYSVLVNVKREMMDLQSR